MAFAAFALSMAAGRFVGDLLIARFGPIVVLRVSGALMALGVGAAVLIPTWPAVLMGFTTVGFGIANLVPILFGVAGRMYENGAGPGLATVTTLGYSGFCRVRRSLGPWRLSPGCRSPSGWSSFSERSSPPSACRWFAHH